MTKFGKTWFGAIWLHEQEEYYYSDIFPIGKSYANANKVFDLIFLDDTIEAKVNGNFKDYYNVSISFKQFSDEEKDIIIDKIKKNPSYLASILNNKFPKKLFDELEEDYVDIMKIIYNQNCNCSDFYSEPCKHIAALIYQVSVEFDRNPLKLLELQGLNLIKEFNIETNKDILTVNKFFREDENKYESKDFKLLDFSSIPNLENLIFSILDDKPIFYNKDFKKILNKFYRSFKRYANNFSLLNDEIYEEIMFNEGHAKSEDFHENFQNKWKNPNNWKKFEINFDDKFSIYVDVGDEKLFTVDEKFLISFLIEFYNYADINKYNDNIKFLYNMVGFVIEIIKKEAIIPQLFEFDGKLFIQWMPVLFNSKINDIMNILAEMIPEDMVLYNRNKLSKKQEVIALSSILIKGMLYSYVQHGITKELSKNFNNPVFDIFVGGEEEFKSNFKGNEILIKEWLLNLYFEYKKYDIYFEFENKDEFITLDLKANEKRVYDILKNKEKETNNILHDVYLIEKYLPRISELIRTGELIKFDLDGFIEFLENLEPIFEIMGISILLPKSIQKYTNPQIILNPSKKAITKNYISRETLYNFNWEIAIGENKISAKEFEKIVKSSEKIVKIANNYIILNQKETAAFVKKLNRLQNLNEFELMQTILTGELDDFDVNIDDKLKKMFDDMIKFEEIPVPSNITTDLRDYQKLGFSWLVQNIKNGFGSILADDMGLGKTIQTLASIQYFKQEGMLNDRKILIVMPNGLLLNWMREIEKFTPDIKAAIYHGTNREIPKEDFDVLLTSYGILRSDKDKLNEKNWFLLVIDEAQNIKNPGTKQTKAVKEINADNKIALSGTPIENRLSEYWSIFDFTNPHYLPSFKKFTDDYIKPIELLRDSDVLNRFKTITAPFVLRRVKTDKNIIDDLPDKIVNDVYCDLTPKQAAIYQETLDSLMNDIYEEEGTNRKGIILKLINSLKQICNHPAQFLKSKNFKSNQSGKMEVLLSILDNILANDEKVIIFTQYVQMGEIIKKLVEKAFNVSIEFLHGGLNKEEKDKVIQNFQDKNNCKILLTSLKTGGTGLNLTVAQNVIHYDLWWNPAVEDQATDRVYRIGQKNKVIVYRLITSGTFEEKIDYMLKEKKKLVDLTVSNNQTFITEMDDNQLANLLKLRN